MPAVSREVDHDHDATSEQDASLEEVSRNGDDLMTAANCPPFEVCLWMANPHQSSIKCSRPWGCASCPEQLQGFKHSFSKSVRVAQP